MKIFFLIIFSLYTCLITAQVIINRGASRTQFVVNSTDQFEISSNSTETIWNIGASVSPSSSAQLQLASANKAFLINRVNLTSVLDQITIPTPKDGMMAYNTNTAGTYPDNVVPGLYYMSEDVWWRLSDIDPGTSPSVSLKDLQTTMASASVSGSSPQTQWISAATLSMGTITINATGTYTFSIRLYGNTNTTSSIYHRGVGYLYLVKNNTTLIDYQQVVMPFCYAGGVVTYTIVLMSPVLAVGDQITLRLATPTGSPNINLISHPGLRADKTSLIYWRN